VSPAPDKANVKTRQGFLRALPFSLRETRIICAEAKA
jgi:hypothetical protein